MKLDGVLLYLVVMSVCRLCISYSYIDMVIVVVHDIMVCGRYGHALIIW